MFCVNAKCPGKDVDGNRLVLNSEKEQYLAQEKEREEKKNGETKETKEETTEEIIVVNECPEGALRVKAGMNSLKNALKEAKEKGIHMIFLEDGVHTFDHKDDDGDDCYSLVIDFPVTIIGESKDGCTIIGGLRMKGKKEDDVTVKHLTISRSKDYGVYGNGMSFHLFHLKIEKSEYHGVLVRETKRSTMSNCQVSHSKNNGVYVQGGLITMNGSGTSIHNNVTGGDSDYYGLRTWDSSSSIHLVSPLTKESVSINNGGGGNYGGDGTIKTV